MGSPHKHRFFCRVTLWFKSCVTLLVVCAWDEMCLLLIGCSVLILRLALWYFHVSSCADCFLEWWEVGSDRRTGQETKGSWRWRRESRVIDPSAGYKDLTLSTSFAPLSCRRFRTFNLLGCCLFTTGFLTFRLPSLDDWRCQHVTVDHAGPRNALPGIW